MDIFSFIKTTGVTENEAIVSDVINVKQTLPGLAKSICLIVCNASMLHKRLRIL